MGVVSVGCAAHRLSRRNGRHECPENQALFQFGVASCIKARVPEQLARAAAQLFGQTNVHEEGSDEGILRKGAESVRFQGTFERGAAGVLGSDTLVVDDDLRREGAGEFAMDETVDDQLAYDGIAGADGKVAFHEEAVGKVLPAEIGNLSIGIYEVGGCYEPVVVAIRVVLAHKCVGFVGGAQRSNDLVLSEKNDGRQIVPLLSC